MKQKRKFYEKNFDTLKVAPQLITVRNSMKINIIFQKNSIMKLSKTSDANVQNGNNKTMKNVFL